MRSLVNYATQVQWNLSAFRPTTAEISFTNETLSRSLAGTTQQSVELTPPFNSPDHINKWDDFDKIRIIAASAVQPHGAFAAQHYLFEWTQQLSLTQPVLMEVMLHYRWTWSSDLKTNIEFPEKTMGSVEVHFDPVAGFKNIGDAVVQAYKPRESPGSYIALIYQTMLMQIGTYIPSFKIECHYSIPWPSFQKLDPTKGLYTVSAELALHCTTQMYYAQGPRAEASEGWEVVTLTDIPPS